MKFHDALALMAGETCLQVSCTASLAQVREEAFAARLTGEA